MWDSPTSTNLAHHPSTAMRIARKLCHRFVSDQPPASLVNALAATYRDVRDHPRRAGAVDDGTPSNHQIVLHRCPRRSRCDLQ